MVLGIQNATIDTGVEFLDNTAVISPIYEGEYIAGVLTRTRDDGEKKEIRGKLLG